MTSPIRVALLGETPSGKTCYVVGMYGVLREGTNGLTLTSTDANQDRGPAEHWERMRTATGPIRWPCGSDQEYEYSFQLSYFYDSFCRIVLRDYKGRGFWPPSIRRQKVGELVESTCVLLFRSADYLTDPERSVNDVGSSGIEVNDDAESVIIWLNHVMSEVAREAREKGRPLPGVAIVLTKYDLIAGWPREAVLEKVRELFRPLYDYDWTVTICTVSLGRELAGNLDAGKIEPVNLHLPIVFAYDCFTRSGTHSRYPRQEEDGRWPRQSS